MNFQAIRNARKAAGVTQEQLAEVLGINRATLSKYETGVIEPSVSQLKTIAAALRIDFYVLANEIGNEWFDAGFEFAEEGSDIIDALVHEKHKKVGYSFSEEEGQLITAFSSLNPSGQTEAVKRVSELTEIPRYQRSDAQDAAKGTEDTSLPAETPINGSGSPTEQKIKPCTNVQSIDKMNLDGYTEKYKKGAAGTVSPLKVL